MVLYNFSNEEPVLLEYNRTKINQRERHSHSITQVFSKSATLKPIAMKVETYSLAHSLLVLVLLDFALLSLYALPSCSIVNSLRTQVVSPLYPSQFKTGVYTEKCRKEKKLGHDGGKISKLKETFWQ